MLFVFFFALSGNISHLSIKSAELDNLKIEFENHCERHMSLSDEYHPSHIQTNLKVAVMEADEESEVVAEKFLDSEYICILKISIAFIL